LNTCEWCGTEFEPDVYHPNARFCSPRCRDDSYNHKRREARTKIPSVPSSPEPAQTEDLISELHKRGYFVTKQPQQRDERFPVNLARFDGDVFKFGAVSDPHLCSRYQQLTHFRSMYALFAEREISTVFNSGDVVEGNGRLYRGQEYEIFVHGADEQLSYAAEYYPKEEGITTYLIGGSHDNSFYKAGGFDILKALSGERPDLKYMGVHGAYVIPEELEDFPIYLMHPSGGIPYARSYRLQKTIENFAPENKPRMVLSGHLHIGLHLPSYRNVEGLQIPCFQAQTPYLKGKGLFPMIGGAIFELTVRDADTISVRVEWFPFFVPIDNDF